MTVELEDRLRAALHREADRAPLRSPEWTEPQRIDRAHRPHRPIRPAVAAGLAAVAVGGLVMYVRDRSDREPVMTVPTAPAPSTPAGTEYPLAEIAPQNVTFDIAEPDQPIKPGSLHIAEIDGITIASFITIGASNGNRVDELRCETWSLDIGACAMVSQGGPHVGEWGPPSSGSEIENQLLLWYDVPDDAAYVTFTDGTTVLWQRPVGSLAIFPSVPDGGDTVEAVTANGTVLMRVDLANRPELAPDPADVYDNLDGTENAQVEAAAFEAAHNCLVGLADPTMPITTAPDEQWDRCVAAAQVAASLTFTTLGGEAVADPADDPSLLVS